jgi:hypothetical protein
MELGGLDENDLCDSRNKLTVFCHNVNHKSAIYQNQNIRQ